MENKDDVLRRYRNPLFKSKLSEFTKSLDGINKSCGDFLNVYIFIENSTVKNISYDGDGCSIAIYSADILCQKIIGKPLSQAIEIILDLKNVYNLDFETNSNLKENYPEFYFLRQYPNRLNCAKLSLNLVSQILDC